MLNCGTFVTFLLQKVPKISKMSEKIEKSYGHIVIENNPYLLPSSSQSLILHIFFKTFFRNQKMDKNKCPKLTF